MKRASQLLWLAFGFTGAIFTVPGGVSAQIIPDSTLGGESSVVTPINSQVQRLDGGALRGDNLFHSFAEFNIAEDSAAYFANPVAVENIFSRVTGSNPSHLFGKLGVLGEANLFFLNPNGIVFGPNASLDLRGAFVASTGDSFVFPGGEVFSATNPEAAPLLTVNVVAPIGLQFEGSSGAIVNAGNLVVEAGQSLSLLGGTVVNDGELVASGGEVSLVALPGSSLVELGSGGEVLGWQELRGSVDGKAALSVAELLVGAGLDSVYVNPETVVINGEVDVAAEVGGTVNVSGDRVKVAGVIDASGVKGGEVNLSSRYLENRGEVFVNGETGGKIAIETNNFLDTGELNAVGSAGDGGTIAVDYTGTVIQTASAVTDASGSEVGGVIRLQGGRVLTTSGQLAAAGEEGGKVHLFGETVQLLAAGVDVRGDSGGGEILVGGDFQGQSEGVENAQKVIVNHSSSLQADARVAGDGGKVIVWADEETEFYGSVTARGGKLGGDGGFIEVSGKEELVFAGSADAGAVDGVAGQLLLDPKNIVIDTVVQGNSFQLYDPNPAPGNGFGENTTVLKNGNIVISSPFDDLTATDAGSVYLFEPHTSAILGSISGANPDDRFGSDDILALPNSNYVFGNGGANIGGREDAGTVILVDGTTGTEINRISGVNPGDSFGFHQIVVLPNGNYVFDSILADIESIGNAGTVILVDGTTGTEINRISGPNLDDRFGLGQILTLPNSNYVFGNRLADIEGIRNAGTVILADGTTGTEISRISGVNPGDSFGSDDIFALPNSNYVFGNRLTDIEGREDAGTVILADGTTGTEISRISGVNPGDSFGSNDILALPNGNYVFGNAIASIRGIRNAGTVILADGTTGTEISRISGTNPSDMFGSDDILALPNGNYVFGNRLADIGGREYAGTVILADGTTGTEISRISGINPDDKFGSDDILALPNGNYVFGNRLADIGTRNAGTVILADGTTGTEISRISVANPSDSHGSNQIVVLPNGNYIIGNRHADIGTRNAGTVILADGTTGTEISRISGINPDDLFGSNQIVVLPHGNYVFANAGADIGGIGNAGTVILADGTTGTEISRISGANPGDSLGSNFYGIFSSNGISSLPNGNYLIASPEVNNNSGRVDIGIANPNTLTYNYFPDRSITLTPKIITSVTDTGTSVILQANNDITVNQAITSNNSLGDGGSLTLQAGRSIFINQDITTDNGNLTLIANDVLNNGVVNNERDPGIATITMLPGTTIDTGTGNININLDNGAGLTNNSSGDVTLNNILANNLTVNSSGAIIGNGILDIKGDASFTSTLTGVGSVSVTNTQATNIGNSIIGGNFSLNSNGAVSQAPGEILQLAGNISVNGGGSNPLVNTIGTPTPVTILPNGDKIITQVGTVNLESQTIAGNLTVNSLPKAVLQFNEVLAAPAITLNQANSFGGTLRFNTAIGDAVTVEGTPGIIQSGSLDVAGTATFKADTGNISLEDSGNRFGNLAFVGNNVSIQENNATNLLTSAATGNLELTSGGAITQTGALSIAGDASFTTTLAQAGNVTINNSNSTTIGQSLVGGNLTITSGGSVSQVPGEFILAPSFNISDPNFVLNNPQLTPNGNGSLVARIELGNGDVIITQVGTVNLEGETISGNLTVNSLKEALKFAGIYDNAAAITLDESANSFGGTLRLETDANTIVVASGTPGITQSNSLQVNGTATFNAEDGDITLNDSSNQFGKLAFQGANVSIQENDTTNLLNSIATENLLLTANGAITQSGGLKVTGESNFVTLSPDADISLNANNQLNGIISFATNGKGDVSLANFLVPTQIAETNLLGDLTINSGGEISQTGTWNVAGNTTLNSGNSDITLQDNNDFSTLAINRGQNVAIEDINGINLGDSSVSGNLVINAQGNITTENISTSGGNITLTTKGEITVANSEISSSTFGLGKPGDIRIEANSLSLRDNALISAATFSEGEGGKIKIDVTDVVEILDGSGVESNTFSRGDAGEVTIKARNLRIDSSNFGSTGETGISSLTAIGSSGEGGNILIDVSESVEIIGNQPGSFTPDITQPGSVFAVASIPTGISTGTLGFGNSGKLTINTGRLTIKNGAGVTTGTVSPQGNGGELNINANEVELQGLAGIVAATTGGGDSGNLFVDADSVTLKDGAVISTDTAVSGSGNAGKLDIITNQLHIINGSRLGSATANSGTGGNINIQATDLIEVRGTSADEQVRSGIVANSINAGDTGNIAIIANRINLLNGGEINVSSTGTAAKAGDLTITANTLFLDNQGQLIAETKSGDGGNITLRDSNLLLMRRNSLISTTAGTAQQGGNGGNININADFIVALPSENSDITANAFEGRGGNINITTQAIFGLKFRDELTPLSDITASSELGVDGTVNINTPGIDPSRGLSTLPNDAVAPDVNDSCEAIEEDEAVAFFDIGKGGTLTNPDEPVNAESWRWLALAEESASTEESFPPQVAAEMAELIASCDRYSK